MESSRQEYWSGLPFLSPGDLPDPEIDPKSATLQTDSLLSEPPFDWDHIKPVDCFGEYGHFNNINSSNPKGGISFYFFDSSSISFINVL